MIKRRPVELSNLLNATAFGISPGYDSLTDILNQLLGAVGT